MNPNGSSGGLRTPELYAAEPASCGKPKYYVLEMLPYPSGQLHMGHVRNYSIGDALARHMWMRGYNVLHPMGWDAFGLPAENAALKNNTPPREWTLANIAAMKRQMLRLGLGYDWATEVTTCLPEYYRWNQWFFLRMYEKGLAYRKKSKVNWCPECATVLANEQVVDGCCWRHETTPVEQRDLVQWFFRITAYAQELLDGLDKLDGWPEKVRTMQRNWIGRSEGTEVDFFLRKKSTREQGLRDQGIETTRIRVFTTRVDTIFGATSVQLAPQHALVAEFTAADQKLKAQVDELIEQQKKAREAGDLGAIEKHGVPTGRFAINPYNGERVPIWVANYILADYGTGAIMSVPAHDERDFEFATKYGLPIVEVIRPARKIEDGAKLPFVSEDGVLVNSGEYDGMSCAEAQQNAPGDCRAATSFGKATVTFRIKDWGVSRQRYWGTPIPMIHCEKDGLVAVPDDQLPVLLPEQIEITQQGGSPLSRVPDFVNTTCPKCGGPAKRETDTMDTFVDSSWYFYRYTDAKKLESALRSCYRAVLVPHRPVHRRRGARNSASDLLALLDQGDARPGADRERRAGAAAVHAGHGHQGRRKNVQVEGQRGFARRYGCPLRRRRHAHVRPVCRAAGPRSGLAGGRRGRGEPISWPASGGWSIACRRKRQKFASSGISRSAQNQLAETTEAEAKLLRKLHQTIAKITLDFEGRWHFNTCIAAIMDSSMLLAADAATWLAWAKCLRNGDARSCCAPWCCCWLHLRHILRRSCGKSWARRQLSARDPGP